jgi:RNA ligase (TIGR02306 family)
MRKLATIRRIDQLLPIEGANAIECAVVGGWKSVVKKGEFNVTDLVIYCEVDSWIPHEIAPFLTKPDRFPKEYNGILGERLKTVKLRGQISQGLILPLDCVDGKYYIDYGYEVEEGDDVSEYLGITKWERPLPAQLAGMARGNFPTEVPKTDEERIQNIKNKELFVWSVKYVTSGFEETEKLEGSSCTFYLDLDDIFHVCSRNIDIKQSEDNTFWKVAIKNDVESKMRAWCLQGYAIQGEVIGEGIQGNYYGITGHEFYVFKIYDVKNGCFKTPAERKGIAGNLKLKHVPVINENVAIHCNIAKILSDAEGKSLINPCKEREGVVYKSNVDDVSFKAISNRFLLKND